MVDEKLIVVDCFASSVDFRIFTVGTTLDDYREKDDFWDTLDDSLSR